MKLRRSLLACVLTCAAITATAAPASADTSFIARGSVEQVYATGLPAGAAVSLVNRAGGVVATRSANSLGGTVFRKVSPGGGYRVRLDASGEQSAPLRVMSTRNAPPSTAVYDQSIKPSGYQYLTTRDGTQLAIDVHPPQDVSHATPLGYLADPPAMPPTPTLIEYSGYGYANPDGGESSIGTVANLMGFTVVDVNMRGTGCSGGAYDFFETLQNLDGYDVIETIARQPWVLNHQVGMMGISFGGISQLFVAQTNPPHLAAVAPFSVIDQTQTTLYPGGILNTSFAVGWAKDRVHDGAPSSANTGQPWAWKRIQGGDQTCKANQVLHPEAVDLIQKIRDNNHYVPAVADPLSPITFVRKIHVPVFMACQWEDEQTGGHCPTLAEHMTGTTKKWFTFTNGAHIDSLDPDTYNRWYDFMSIYVAKRGPAIGAAEVQASAPLVYQAAMGINNVTLPPDPLQAVPSYTVAKALFEKEPSIRVLFDNGAGTGPNQSSGEPYAGFAQNFERFPIPGTTGQRWYFGDNATLADSKPVQPAADGFTWDAHATPLTSFTGNTGGGGLWGASPDWQWKQHPAGTAVSYLSAPLNKDTTVVGAGAVHAWVRSSTPNVDLQATISEVRPDGKETFVQNGWVRANERALDVRKSTPLEPVLSLRAEDVAPLPSDRFVKVTIPLYYEGHAYRTGSRIRVTIAAPNGDQAVWGFAETQPDGQANVAIGRGAGMPSDVVLPVVPGVSVSSSLPPCPSLRAEACRTFAPFTNDAAQL